MRGGPANDINPEEETDLQPGYSQVLRGAATLQQIRGGGPDKGALEFEEEIINPMNTGGSDSHYRDLVYRHEHPCALGAREGL